MLKPQISNAQQYYTYNNLLYDHVHSVNLGILAIIYSVDMIFYSPIVLVLSKPRFGMERFDVMNLHIRSSILTNHN